MTADVSDDKISVLLQTEGTYPYVGGGVSTWCHILCEYLPEVDWSVFAVVADPYGDDRYDTKAFPQIKSITRVPLWGAEETAEHIDTRPFRHGYTAKLRTTRRVIRDKFVPLFIALLEGFEAPDNEVARYGPVIHELYRYFQEYDYKVSFQSEEAWAVFRDFYTDTCHAQGWPEALHPSLFDVTTAMRWLYNMFLPIAAKIPETDVTHATIAGSTALAGIVSRFEYGTPFLLTDHGVYIRERYIACSAADMPFFRKRFLVKMAGFYTRLCYFYADQISPCAHFNGRWELAWGAAKTRQEAIDFGDCQETGVVPNLKTFGFIRPIYDALVDLGEIEAYNERTEFPWIRTIYNGVDTDRFVPGEKPEHLRGRPTTVALARVFPLKDILTMIRACAVVVKAIPDVMMVVYGSVKADPDYVGKCQALIEELGVQDNFNLAGFHSKPHQAFWEGDISLLSSISEGFPFTVLESMACGVPVVGTDVGGVKEAIGVGADATGIVVPPQDPQAFGEAVIRLLKDDALRLELARRSRERVLRLFQTATSVDAYMASYRRLAALKQQRKQLAERAA